MCAHCNLGPGRAASRVRTVRSFLVTLSLLGSFLLAVSCLLRLCLCQYMSARPDERGISHRSGRSSRTVASLSRLKTYGRQVRTHPTISREFKKEEVGRNVVRARGSAVRQTCA
ncbi:hypothetical protein C8Q77DRAFT_720634 [Trametes polyzona]|nr:hypothetical protein C8Q77DRAFT_720634 [Trametes polyzona]